MLKKIALILVLGACGDNTVEVEPYACRAQIECFPKHDPQYEVFDSGFYVSKQAAKDAFAPQIHQRGLSICYPELYNTKAWDCGKIPYCSELGCSPADYSLKCAYTGDCQCDPDARGPEPAQQCYPDATVGE